MSRVRRLLASRTLLGRVEHLEATVRQLQTELAGQRSLGDPTEVAITTHERRVHQLEMAAQLDAVYSPPGPHVHPRCAVVAATDVAQGLTAIATPYVCVVDDATQLHHRWLDVAVGELDGHPAWVAVHGASVLREGGEWYWAEAATSAATAVLGSMVMRHEALSALELGDHSSIAAAVFAAGPVGALAHPAQISRP
jgi:hypothetical protein